MIKYCKGSYSHTQEPTVGIDFLAKTVDYKGTVFRFQIWDTGKNYQANLSHAKKTTVEFSPIFWRKFDKWFWMRQIIQLFNNETFDQSKR